VWEGGSAAFDLPDLPGARALLIGRSRECDVSIDHHSVSRQHARLHPGSSLQIEDLGSSNGTRISGEPLPPHQLVAIPTGAIVEIGSTLLVVQPARASAAREGAPGPLDHMVSLVAASDISVLILGETGVGKEVLAERIHRASTRAAAPMVRVNCAALPEALLESELFGHVRGAFTGAVDARPGLFEAADRGTLFLDEIAEMPPAMQVKLLRVLESREVRPVGAARARVIDVRFIAATSRDIAPMVASGAFRPDLYYRLDGISIEVQPLRARKHEIPDLAAAFARAFAARMGRPMPAIRAEALRVLDAHTWPGNVRELRNAVERAAVLAAGGAIGPEHVVLDRRSSGTRAISVEAPVSDRVLRADVADLERRRVVDALDRSGGNQSQAAKLLGITRKTLASHMDTYGVPRARGGGKARGR